MSGLMSGIWKRGSALPRQISTLKGSDQQLGYVFAKDGDHLAANLGDPGVGHPEDSGDLRELHVFIIVLRQYLLL